MLLGVALGMWADGSWGTGPWMVIVGSMLGVAAATYLLIKEVSRIGR